MRRKEFRQENKVDVGAMQKKPIRYFVWYDWASKMNNKSTQQYIITQIVGTVQLYLRYEFYSY